MFLEDTVGLAACRSQTERSETRSRIRTMLAAYFPRYAHELG
jgi:hypothetical protein